MEKDKELKESREFFFVVLFLTVIVGTYVTYNEHYISLIIIVLVGFPTLLYFAKKSEFLD